ncbi:MAG: ABC transporter ATP-binding protein [Chthoniobacterales bacterium]
MKADFSDESVLAVRSLSVRRGRVQILRNIDWRVGVGEHWVVLGANGSGKTSLLKCLSGYFTPTSGEVDLLGESFGGCDWRELRERIGIVGASISQMISEDDIVLDIVIGGRFGMMGIWGDYKKADRRDAKKFLRQVHVGHLEQRPWHYLSQGERQRTLIARALMASPRLMILDEPCSGLDPVAREEFLQFINGANLAGVPLIFVTHHVEEIVERFTHGLFIRDGRVLAQGPLKKTMTSKILSETFDRPLRVRKSGGRYQLGFTRSIR